MRQAGWREIAPQRGPDGFRRLWLGAALCLALAACAEREPPARTYYAPSIAPALSPLVITFSGGLQSAGYTETATTANPRIVTPPRRLECVSYARKLTNIQIRGNAWTWWDAAKGRYRRGRQPAVGAVLVLRRKGRSLGHLAVVTQVASDRVVIANHANWLNRGQIHMNTPIHDVSRHNDWSAVKIWYTPGNVLGRSAYPAYGFIYAAAQSAAR